MATIYSDASLEITDDAITIHDYYFPFGQSKIIPWSAVKKIWMEPLTFWNWKYRVWGMGLRPQWFNSQWRADMNEYFVIDTGHIMKSAITPDDFEAARKAILQHFPKISDRR